MDVGEAVCLVGVLGVLEVILHLTFRLCSLMHELDEVGVGLEVGDLLDGMIESIQKTCHSLLIIFRDIALLQDVANATLRVETLRRNCVRCNNRKRWCKKTIKKSAKRLQ